MLYVLVRKFISLNKYYMYFFAQHAFMEDRDKCENIHGDTQNALQ